MPTISFIKDFPPIQAAKGSNLREILNQNERPVASSCCGQGICTRCLLNIASGLENLSKENELEVKMRNRHKFTENYRLSCQTKVLGDITIDASYW